MVEMINTRIDFLDEKDLTSLDSALDQIINVIKKLP